MTQLESSVGNASVLDTAHWVAVYRAIESSRADALFHDPFATRLAGKLGENIPQQIPPWPMITRTKLIDALVLNAVVNEGVEPVLNLAAGLDSRPYRLALPPSLRWVETDFPAMIEEKALVLRSEMPVCQLAREKIDLTDLPARTAFLDRILQDVKNALVITEGLLLYPDENTVQALSRELAIRPQIRSWITDLASPATIRQLQKQTQDFLTKEESHIKFGPANGGAFFAPLGWKPKAIYSLIKEARRMNRLPFFLKLISFLPEPSADNPGENRLWGAVIVMQQTNSVA